MNLMIVKVGGNDMDISEAKVDKQYLEIEILELIRKFSVRTGLVIDDIDLDHTQSIVKGREVSRVRVRVSLE